MGPNALTGTFHDRMPVILKPDSYDVWLDPGMKDGRAAQELLKPYDARVMRCYPISTRINFDIESDSHGTAVLVAFPLASEPAGESNQANLGKNLAA